MNRDRKIIWVTATDPRHAAAAAAIEANLAYYFDEFNDEFRKECGIQVWFGATKPNAEDRSKSFDPKWCSLMTDFAVVSTAMHERIWRLLRTFRPKDDWKPEDDVTPPEKIVADGARYSYLLGMQKP